MSTQITGGATAQHEVFDRRFIEIKSFYLFLYQKMPSISFIGQIRGEKACRLFLAAYAGLIADTVEAGSTPVIGFRRAPAAPGT